MIKFVKLHMLIMCTVGQQNNSASLIPIKTYIFTPLFSICRLKEDLKEKENGYVSEHISLY